MSHLSRPIQHANVYDHDPILFRLENETLPDGSDSESVLDILSLGKDLAIMALLDDLVVKKLRINEFSFMTVTRTKDGRLVSVFELIYGNSKFNRKLVIKTEDVLRMIGYLRSYRSIFYPSCEITLRCDNERITKMIFHPSTYSLSDKAVTFGVWYRQSKNDKPPPCFTFTLYNRYEIDRIISLYSEIETLYMKQTNLNVKITDTYNLIAKEIEESMKKGVYKNIVDALRDINDDDFIKRHNIENEILSYIRIKCREDFISFMETNYGDAYNNNQPSSEADISES